MANTVTSQKILDGERNLVMKFTSIADTSTAEASVVKIDLSALNPSPSAKTPCTGIVITRVHGAASGSPVDISWGDTTAPALIYQAPTDQGFDFCAEKFGGIPNNAPTPTGDVVFSREAGAGGYSIVIEANKKYD